jgi:hypothetical protein
VLVGVMLAEEQLTTCGKDCAYTRGRTATVAPVDRGQWGASQGSWHDSSVLAPGAEDRSPGVGLAVYSASSLPLLPSRGYVTTLSDVCDGVFVPGDVSLCFP